MTNVLIISAFGKVENDTNDRVNSIYDYFPFEKTIITTNFSHREKQYRQLSSVRNVIYISVPKYKKNLSVKRIFSHWVFAIRLLIYLVKLKQKPDLIYCICPTISSLFTTAIYVRFKKVKFVVDVIDIWPEGLIARYKWLKVILQPWIWMTIFAYKTANLLIAATHDFKNRISKYNPKVPSEYFSLGINVQLNTRLLLQSTIELHKPTGEIWICYAGNLGHSYDFDLIFTAFENIQKKYNNIKLYIIGGGVKLEYIKDQFHKRGIKGYITGNLSYSDYLKYLSYCDIGLNLYVKTSPVAQSYKFNDYVFSSLITINNLKGETADLIMNYKIGFNMCNSNEELTGILELLIENWEVYSHWKNNCHLLLMEKLDQEKEYNKLVSFVKTNLDL